MASRPPIIKHDTVMNGQPTFHIFGATERLDDFFSSGALIPHEKAAAQDKTSSVRSYSRRRYPGGKLTQVDASQRVTLPGDTERAAGARPGERFWCEYTYTASNGDVKRRVCQFAYDGTWRLLKMLAKNNAARSYTLRNSSGEKLIILD